MFYHFVASLLSDYVAEVRDLLLKPPTENLYVALKEQLTRSQPCQRSPLLHDCNSKTRFLVNTGAEVSVIPTTCLEYSHPQSAFSIQ